ncbi:MAG: ABC transporter permease [Myxococcales bacterium]|nr:ABC transporter permease [Myxococcales bacterium]
MAPDRAGEGGRDLRHVVERVGERAAEGVEEVGLASWLVGQSLLYLGAGRRLGQPVRLAAVLDEAVQIGIAALPITTLLAATIGLMLALQGIDTLSTFGAESQIVIGVAFGVTREFAPLITGILVAGRSGSALAARLATMTINQEVDALRVMGVDPVRFLLIPSLLASIVMVPALTLWSMIVSQLAAGIYVQETLGIDLSVYVQQTFEILRTEDLMHGLSKSVIFAVVIVVIAVVNGASVTGGAEGVGRRTTRTVVHCISAIILTDMLFVWIAVNL